MRHGAALLAVLLYCASAVAAQPRTFAGHTLTEALRILQQAGIPIVFSSEIVTPGIRVTAEPRAGPPRRQLDDLLAPHGLKAEAGPGGVVLIVRASSTADRRTSPRGRQPAGRLDEGGSSASPIEAPAGYVDRLTVWGSRGQVDRGSSETTLDASALRVAGTSIQSDGLDAIRAMPGVAAFDDYRGDFSVRGSPYRQVAVVIDGVPTHWLQHAVYGRPDAGSLGMFAAGVLDRATLQAGAHPRRYDDALGAQLELTLREGSRDATRVTGIAGSTSAAVFAEGPIGSERRGSWLAGVRNSLRSWPPRTLSANDVGFAFADAHAKLVYDVSPRHEISLTALAGRSSLETADEPLVGPLGSGIDRAALVTVGWRSTLGSRTSVGQRVSVVGQELLTTLPSGGLAGRGTNRAFGYHSEVLHAVFGGVLEAGGDVSRVAGTRTIGVAASAPASEMPGATWTTHGAYVNFAREERRGLSVEAGARVGGSTLVGKHTLAPWILAAWRFRPDWTIHASVGGSRQFPELDAVLGSRQSIDLVPERATNVDVGIEQRRPPVVWQATLFDRSEQNVLRTAESQAILIPGTAPDSLVAAGYANALVGIARGVELVVKSAGTGKVAGWASYTFAIARQTDNGTLESFWSDGDRRHALNAAGVLRVGQRASLGLVLRAGSGVPIPGYFQLRSGRLFLGSHRNEVRLPPYLRLDTRAQRTFVSSRGTVTLFAELLNVLNRRNEGLAEGRPEPSAGEVTGVVRPLLPRRFTVGIEVSVPR